MTLKKTDYALLALYFSLFGFTLYVSFSRPEELGKLYFFCSMGMLGAILGHVSDCLERDMPNNESPLIHRIISCLTEYAAVCIIFYLASSLLYFVVYSTFTESGLGSMAKALNRENIVVFIFNCFVLLPISFGVWILSLEIFFEFKQKFEVKQKSMAEKQSIEESTNHSQNTTTQGKT